MRHVIRWFLIILLSFLLVILGGILFYKVIMPLTSWIWWEQLPDGSSRIHTRAALFVVGLLFLSLAAVLAGVTRIVDWALFPERTKMSKRHKP